MNRSRLHAVDHVHLDAPPGAVDALRWFYGELLGLPSLDAPPDEDCILCFGANRLNMRLFVRERPQVNPRQRRLTLETESLDEQAERLAEAGLAFGRRRGWSYTDQCIYVHDPVGHLVELRRHWPM
ncbi:MAG: VOC family protein [Phycisphaerae bacterium]